MIISSEEVTKVTSELLEKVILKINCWEAGNREGGCGERAGENVFYSSQYINSPDLTKNQYG